MKSYYWFRWRHWQRAIQNRIAIGTGFSRGFIKKYILRRSQRIKAVDRFLAGWLAVFALAIGIQFYQFQALEPHYLSQRPSSGGAFVEGVAGEFSALNPIFADTNLSRAASRLLFSGLLKRDYRGKLVPDLASRWDSNGSGTVYTVHLRPDASWHDGTPMTADDVIFTVKLIQDEATVSPLRSDWRDVKVTSPGPGVVQFELPSPFAPFPQHLTLGLLPEHLLQDVAPARLRVHDFNLAPVGNGPYRFDQFLPSRQELRLKAFENYASGAPKISTFVLRAYDDYRQIAAGLKAREINAAGAASAEETYLLSDLGLNEVSWPVASQTFLFMNTAREPIKNKSLRRAITRSISPHELVSEYGSLLQTASSPLLPTQAVDPELRQLTYSPLRAKQLLKQVRPSSLRRLNLVAPNEGIYPLVASQLQQQLQQSGLKIELSLVSSEEIRNERLRSKNYDLLLFSVNLGGDPDVYPYWHSSQAGADGFNLSNYRSAVADRALEGGRTRLDPVVREAKYEQFLKAWKNDSPAVALYRPKFTYFYRGLVDLNLGELVDPLDRFSQVGEWSVKTAPILKRLVE